MPKISPYKDKSKKERALKLYKEGLSLRDIGQLVGRSHEWVRKVVGDNSLTKTDSLIN